MTNKSIKWVIIIVFLVLIVLVYFLPSKYRKVYDSQGQRMSGPYIITSSNPNELPDILANQKIADTIQVLHKDSKSYRVYSIMNDEKLKKLIIDELGLQENQVSVNSFEIIYVFLTIFLYLLKCPQSLILSALRAFCFCGKPHISRSIFLYFRYQAWLKSW